MLPLPMNEFSAGNLKQACGVDVAVEAVEWQILLNAAARHAGRAVAERRDGAERQLAFERLGRCTAISPPPTSRRSAQLRAVEGRQVRGGVRDAAEATDEATIPQHYATAHERLVDNPPWLFIVHDLNPRAFTRRVKGFVSPQSWFVDLTLVDLE